MFTQPSPQDVEERYKTLPEDIQAAIVDESVSYNIEQLGIKYNLRVDKIGDLVDEVGLVMLGFKKSSDFIKSLSKRLEVDRETAESLAVDVDNEVFKKIRESLRTVQFDPREKKAVAPEPQAVRQAPVVGINMEEETADERDSLLQEIERHGNDDVSETNGEIGATEFTSSSDYNPEGFGEGVQPEAAPAQEQFVPAPTPYEQTVISEEEKIDPNKTFKDHLEKKMEAVKPIVNADPYRESIE